MQESNLMRSISRSRRPGVTVLEVLFAVFVIVIGLLGIASLIPLASRNADQSNASNQALALGKIWVNDFLTRGFNDPDSFTANSSGYNWQWRNDVAPGGFINFQKSYLGTPLALAGTNTSSTNSAVTANQIVRIWGHQAVCIDPLFMANSDVVRRMNMGTDRYGSYRASVFPYFEDGYNPVTDPYNQASPWHDQPRMIRMTLGLGDSFSLAPMRMSSKIISDIFASIDDVSAFTDDEDEAIAATRIYSTDGTFTSKNVMTGEFTWMATLVPEDVRPSTFDGVGGTAPTQLTTTNSYLLSLLIMHRRDRGFVPAVDSPVAGSDIDKPGGERLIWVTPLSGDFESGAGGQVRLISSAATDDNVHVGDWIMLGKHYLVDPGNTDHRYAFFRWYRIIAVDAEAKRNTLANVLASGGNQFGTGADPYGNVGNLPVWSRDVVLEGPDWSFTPSAGGILTPTTGTLMSNVVTVIERNINVD